MSQTDTTTPRLYVGTYHAYNSGSLHGAWLDLDDYADPAEFWDACAALHPSEADPEFMFQDFEGFPRDLYQESAGVENVARLFDWVALEEYEQTMVAEYMDATGQSWEGVEIADLVEQAQDAYCTTLDASDTEGQATELGFYVLDEGLLGVEIPDALANYIDHKAIGHEWLNEMYVSSNGYVFTQR